MISLTVTSHEQDFVLGVLVTIAVQGVHIIGESFPLHLLIRRIKFIISWIRPVNKPIIARGLFLVSVYNYQLRYLSIGPYVVEGLRDSRGIILLEETCNRRVVDCRLSAVASGSLLIGPFPTLSPFPTETGGA